MEAESLTWLGDVDVKFGVVEIGLAHGVGPPELGCGEFQCGEFFGGEANDFGFSGGEFDGLSEVDFVDIGAEDASDGDGR